mmetsp:Transcript_27488/g.44705  ORF Transcript_27488/g.44705 Transcript_27488/m.44705 type:complete len:377 (+) Transcript_27488:134-1264(+)
MMQNSDIDDDTDEEMGMMIPSSSGSGGVQVSSVTFDRSNPPKVSAILDQSVESRTVGSSPNNSPRRVKKDDMKDIFRASTTVASVSTDQIVRIKKMHDKISDGVDWDFNYVCLLTVASIVASLGLATNSATTVISSMLLSPIMGPVIGMSYGLIIWDLALIKRSARNELLSILACIIFGMLFGVTTSWTEMAKEWPTFEMRNRATRVTFLSGFPTAFFSGLGVALSVLDDSTSSLVGVAISASLLPPAVNCGILMAMSFIQKDDWTDFHGFQQVSPESKMQYQNFSQMAIMSLFLTLANIICVALGATLMFRMKEVLPVKKKVFWEDLKIARRIYQGRARDDGGEVLTVKTIQDMLRPTYSVEEVVIPSASATITK